VKFNLAFLLGVALLVAGVSMVAAFGAGTFQYLGVDGQYNKAVGGYKSNAFDAPTFDLMAAYLNKTAAGMRALGLEPSDYGRAWSWEQTPDQRMDYNFAYIQNLTLRALFYFEKFARANISTFSDVYHSAIMNLRAEFNANGPIDWVAHPAFLLKYHPEFYWGTYVYLLGFGAPGAVLGAVLTYVGRNERRVRGY
jgi:hypothetical protein